MREMANTARLLERARTAPARHMSELDALLASNTSAIKELQDERVRTPAEAIAEAERFLNYRYGY
jgi:hypothetical protein